MVPEVDSESESRSSECSTKTEDEAVSTLADLFSTLSTSRKGLRRGAVVGCMSRSPSFKCQLNMLADRRNVTCTPHNSLILDNISMNDEVQSGKENNGLLLLSESMATDLRMHYEGTKFV